MFVRIDSQKKTLALKVVIYCIVPLQESYQAAQAEIEELKRSVGVASKVGEVARLLEDRDRWQAKCEEREQISSRLKVIVSLLIIKFTIYLA